ncbi:MAG TPA: Gfo/Idh/MocA family oxidoreductase [Candidatus Acidoferrales bacterium]|jgi:predicted dehydrogenase|nr:Gfo/Idh/MocA family oxidoreductase [Candidatus Acidoferrales bacterium]
MSVLVSRPGEARPVPPSDQVNLGVIGVGSRGQELMRVMLRIEGVRVRGLCDVYEPRFAQGRKVTAEETPIYRDYRRLVEARDLDAILVATPLSLHAEHVIAALESGAHVYGEKSMALTLPECGRIVEVVKRTGKHFQIGLQYHYAPWYREALKRIHAGMIGHVTEIYAYWHRNHSWRRPLPDSQDPQLERLINWRLYRAYSGGLLAELGSHHIHFANEVFGGVPESVVGSGGIDYWKDGREVPDNVQVVYRYPGGQTLFLSAVTTNRLDGSQIRVLGTAGSAVLTQADCIFYDEPATARSAALAESVVEHGVVTGASYLAEMPYRGPGHPIEVPEGEAGSADYLACRSFIDCVRSNRRPEADEQAGWAAGVTVAVGNHAIDHGGRVRFAEHVRAAA